MKQYTNNKTDVLIEVVI